MSVAREGPLDLLEAIRKRPGFPAPFACPWWRPISAHELVDDGESEWFGGIPTHRDEGPYDGHAGIGNNSVTFRADHFVAPMQMT